MSVLGLGCAAFGNLYAPVSPGTSLETVRTAVELGIRHFDTAPHYGLGQSEQRLGAALAQIPDTAALVSTKTGRVLEPNPDYRPGDQDPEGFVVPATLRRRWDFTATGLRRSLESSLERLGVDHVDTLYLHDPDSYDLDLAIEVALPALIGLRDEGLVSRIGVGSNDEAALERCVRGSDLDVIMCAGRYTLLEQPAGRSLLPLCLDAGVGVVCAGIFNSGALATDTVPPVVMYNYQAAPPHILTKVHRLHEVCAQHRVSVPQAAIGFVARHPAVEVVMIGARSPLEVRQAHEHMNRQVPEELWADLRSQGLLEEAA